VRRNRSAQVQYPDAQGSDALRNELFGSSRESERLRSLRVHHQLVNYHFSRKAHHTEWPSPEGTSAFPTFMARKIRRSYFTHGNDFSLQFFD
jgi:hypothetical protein